MKPGPICRAAPGCVAALILFALPSPAQTIQSTIDGGVAGVRYADTLNATALTLTPDVKLNWQRAVAEAQGTLSQFTSGEWSTQGALSASLFSSLSRAMIGELAGAVGGSAHKDGSTTWQMIVNGRAHLRRGQGGTFFGVGGGRTWDGVDQRGILLGEAGAWAQRGAASGLLTVSPVFSTDSLRYADAQLSLSLPLRRVDLSAIVGARAGSNLPSLGGGEKAWASVTAAVWLSPRLALVGSGGNYPVDPTQGFPGGRYVSLNVRFAFTPRAVPPPPVPETPDTVVPALPDSGAAAADSVVAVVDSFVVDRPRPGYVSLRARAPLARSVEIMGDFSSWSPLRLEPAGDGWWVIALSVPAGTHQMNIRVDGGKWLVPPGLLVLKDEFGGSTGLLVIQ